MSKKTLASELVSIVSTVVLVFGLMPAPAFAAGAFDANPNESTASVHRSEEAIESSLRTMLATGDYVEGEAVVCYAKSFAANPGELTAQSAVNDLISNAEKLSSVTVQQYVEATGESVPSASPSDSALSAQSIEEEVEITLVHRDDMTTEELIRALLHDPCVLSAEPNYLMNFESIEEGAATSSNETTSEAKQLTTAIVDDLSAQEGSGASTDLSGYQWFSSGAADATSQYLDAQNPGVSAPHWNEPDMKNCDPGSVVVIMDSGVDYTHPDLAGVMYHFSDDLQKQLGCGEFGYAPGRDDKTDPMDGYHHGTHCAGIAAAQWNGWGVSGIANGAEICAISISRSVDNYNYSYDTIIKAYDFMIRAAEAGVDIRSVNRSMSTGPTNNADQAMIQAAGEMGIVTCMATGNNSADMDNHFDNVSIDQMSPYELRVNASRQQDDRAWFSNYGGHLTDVFAPGAGILSTIPTTVEYMSCYFPDADSNPLYKETHFDGALPHVSLERYDHEGKIVHHDLEVTRGDLGVDGDSKSIKAPANMESNGYFDLFVDVPVNDLDDSVVQDVSIALYAGGFEVKMTQLDVLLANDEYTEFGNYEETNRSVSVPYGWTFAAFHVSDPATVAQGFKRIDDGKGNKCIRLRISAMLQTSSPGSSDLIDVELYLDQIAMGKTDNEALLPYRYDTGTSMATPCVTGCAAVVSSTIKGVSPDVRAAQTVRILKGAMHQAEGYYGYCKQNGQVDLSLLGSPDKYVPVLESAQIIGNMLTVKGAYFGSEGTLTVGGVGVQPQAWSSSSITAPWPSGVTSGVIPLVVKTSAGAEACGAFLLDVSGTSSDVALYERELTTPSPRAYGKSTISCPDSMAAAEDGTLFAVADDTDDTFEASTRYLMRSDDQGASWTAIALPQHLKQVSLAAGDGKVFVWGATPADTPIRIDAWHLYSFDIAQGAFTLLRTFEVSHEADDDDSGSVTGIGSLAYAGGGLYFVDCFDDSINKASIMRMRKFNADYTLGEFFMLKHAYQANAFYEGPKVSAAGNSIYVCGLAKSMAPDGDDHTYGIERVDVAADGSLTCVDLSAAIDYLPNGLEREDICMAASDQGVFLMGRTLEGLLPTGAEYTDTFFMENGTTAFKPYSRTLSFAPVFGPASVCSNGWLYAFAVSQFESTSVFGRATNVQVDLEPVHTPKKGESVVEGNYVYTVLSSSAVSVKLSAAGKKSLAKAKIADTVTLGDKTFKVTQIDAEGFASAKKLARVTIGKNVKAIHVYAFAHCAKLKVISGGSAMTRIDASAFDGCSKLASFNISSKRLAKIGSAAFSNCQKLKTLTIAKTTKLTKSGVKNSLVESSVKTVNVKNTKIATYKKYFTAKNCGKNVTVK